MFRNRTLRRLFPVLLLNLIAFAVAIPIIPALTLELGGSASDIGFVFAVQAGGQFATAPVWGDLSDRFGRKPVLIATIAAAAALELLTATVTSLPMLYVARLLVGISAGNVAAASAMVADATPPEERSGGMALIGICFGLGFTIGPAVGAGVSLLPDAYPALFAKGPGLLGTGLPFVAASLLSATSALLGAAILVEPDSATGETDGGFYERLRLLVEHPDSRLLAAMCALFLCYTTSIAILEISFFPYAEELYGFGEAEVGAILAGMGLLAATVQGTVRTISSWVGDRRMTGLGLALLAGGLLLVPGWHVLPYLLGVLAVATVGRALAGPGIRSLTSEVSQHPGETGKILGVLQSSASAARIVGPAIGGVLFDYLGPDAPFVASGVLVALAGGWWWRYTASERVAE